MPVVGPDVGARAAKIHEDHGVKLHLGTVVTEPVGNGRVEGVRLESGELIPADLVLISIGSAPNSEWLEGSGLSMNRGTVVCDEHCFAVGTDNIVAAGDIASWPHPDAGGEPVWVEHWTNARDMGAIAARNLIAQPGDRKPSVPTFWSDQYDVKIKSAGFLQVADRIEVVEEDPGAVAGRRGPQGRPADRRDRLQQEPEDHRVPAPAGPTPTAATNIAAG